MFPLSSGRGGKKETKFFKETNTQQLQWAGVPPPTPAPIILSRERINFAFGKRIFVVM
jgi:hypothetical protein